MTAITLPLRHGQIHQATRRALKNSRWYLAEPGALTRVGWGDISFDDLDAVAAVLPDSVMFLAVPETPFGPEPTPADGWRWDPQPGGAGPAVPDVASAALYLAVPGAVYAVDWAANGKPTRTIAGRTVTQISFEAVHALLVGCCGTADLRAETPAR